MYRYLLVSMCLALGLSVPATAQTTCRLGTALAVAPGVKAPEGVTYFKATGGLVLMSGMASTKTSEVKWVRCLLPSGTESYIGLDGLARPVVCNQPYIPVGWALPDSLFRGRKGDSGHDGKPGEIISGPPVRSDLYVHFTDTLNVKVSGQINLIAQATRETRVRNEGGRGFWCTQNPLKGLVCLAVAVGTVIAGDAIYNEIRRGHRGPSVASDSVASHPKGPGVTSDSAKGPGVTTDTTTKKPVCTGYPCPSGMRASNRVGLTLGLRQRRVSVGFNFPFRLP